MPANCTIDAALNLIIIRCSGTLTNADFIALTERLTQADALACTREICDLRDVEEVLVSPDELKELAKRWRESGAPMKIADVTSTDLSYGLARLFQGYRDDATTELRVFRNMAEAEAWLEIPAGQIDQTRGGEQ